MTGRSISSSRWIWAMAGVAVYLGLYFGVGLREVGLTRSLGTPLDAHIPLWQGAIWVYASVYPAILGPILLVRSPVRFRRIATTLIAVVVVCTACFALFPVETASLRRSASLEPSKRAGPTFAAWGIGLLYTLDPPRNAFPSLHVALATVIALGVGRSTTIGPVARSWREPTSEQPPGTGAKPSPMAWPARAWLAAVFVSVLLVRQHYVVDAVAGLAVGVLAYRIGVGRDGEGAVPGAFERRGAMLLAIGVFAFYALFYAAYSMGLAA